MKRAFDNIARQQDHLGTDRESMSGLDGLRNADDLGVLDSVHCITLRSTL